MGEKKSLHELVMTARTHIYKENTDKLKADATQSDAHFVKQNVTLTNQFSNRAVVF